MFDVFVEWAAGRLQIKGTYFCEGAYVVYSGRKPLMMVKSRSQWRDLAGVMEQVNQGYPKSTSRFRRLPIDSPPLARSAPAGWTR